MGTTHGMTNQIKHIYTALYKYSSLLVTPSGLPLFNSAYYEHTKYNTLVCHLYAVRSQQRHRPIMPSVNSGITSLVPWSTELSYNYIARTWNAAILIQNYLNAI